MDKILILDGHSAAATECVLAFSPCCEVHLAISSGRCVFSASQVKRILHQPGSPDALGDWVEDLFLREQYQLVVPTTEISLHSLKSREVSPELRTRMAIPHEDSIDVALDKQRTVELARQLGIPVPESSRIESLENLPDRTRYPVVIKPLRSKLPVQGEIRSFGARICRDPKERFAACAELLPHTDVIEQEYFRGRGIGVEVLFEHGRLRWWFAHQRIHVLPVTGGASTYRRSIEPPEALLRAAAILLSHLHWHGVAMVEFKVADDGDYRLMEINPRLWGSLPLAVSAGVDFPAGLLCLARGESPGQQPEYRRGLYMRHLAHDLVWYAQSWRERRNPLRIKPLQPGDLLGLLRPLTGSERWDFFRWRNPAVWWRAMRSSVGTLYRSRRQGIARRMASANWMKLQSGWREGRIRNVLVLCHGNICRSPAAARLLAQPGLEVRSAGFLAAEGRTPPPDWIRVVERTLEIDLRGHRPTRVDASTIEWADLILVMDASNWHALSKAFPAAMDRVTLFGVAAEAGVDTFEIPDPFDLEEASMSTVAKALKSCTCALLGQRIARPMQPAAVQRSAPA